MESTLPVINGGKRGNNRGFAGREKSSRHWDLSAKAFLLLTLVTNSADSLHKCSDHQIGFEVECKQKLEIETRRLCLCVCVCVSTYGMNKFTRFNPKRGA